MTAPTPTPTPAVAMVRPADPVPQGVTGTRGGPSPRPPLRRRDVVAFSVLAGLLLVVAAVAGGSWAHASAGGLPVVWCRWHGGRLLGPLSGWRLLTAWQLDTVALVALSLPAAGYAWAVGRVRARHPARPWPRARSASFFAGLVVVVLATCSSIGVYDMTLFSVHMVQHLLLIMVAPPLLAAGRPLTLALHAVGNPWHTRIKRAARSRLVSGLTWPPVAYGAYAVTIVATHLSGLMGAVMTRPWLGQAEHLLYLTAGYLFFVLVFGQEPIRWRLAMPGRLMLVVLSMAVDTFVGIVLLQGNQAITMLPHPGWGSSALVDTQTGGGIMWVFGDGIMAVLVVLLFRAWTRQPEHARRSSRSWLEQSRQATLTAHTGYQRVRRPDLDGPAARTAAAGGVPANSSSHGADLDDDDQALTAYNAWLAALADGSARPAWREAP